MEAEAKKQEWALEKEKQEAAERQQLADLKEQEEKEKEDEANKLALQAAGAPSASDGDCEMDPADPKMATMAELRQRQAITEGKKRVHTAEPQKQKFQSASLVESEGKDGNASAGLLTPKCLKTDPVPQASDKVFSGKGACLHWISVWFADLG